jgi:hypothetical protein
MDQCKLVKNVQGHLGIRAAASDIGTVVYMFDSYSKWLSFIIVLFVMLVFPYCVITSLLLKVLDIKVKQQTWKVYE